MGGAEIVLPRGDHPSGADGTACPADPGLDGGLPAVALFAGPPGFLVTAEAEVVGGQGPVFDRVPLVQEPGAALLRTVVEEGCSHCTTAFPALRRISRKQYFVSSSRCAAPGFGRKHQA